LTIYFDFIDSSDVCERCIFDDDDDERGGGGRGACD